MKKVRVHYTRFVEEQCSVDVTINSTEYDNDAIDKAKQRIAENSGHIVVQDSMVMNRVNFNVEDLE